MGLVRLGVFYLQEAIAIGGSADVWRAVHPPASLAVAVKLLREPVDRQAVAREARAVATLLHPAIVRIVDQDRVRASVARSNPEFLSPGQPYLVMELGEDSLWARPPKPRWRSLKAALHRLLDGLAHAHARGVIHRDLKPSNVLWVRREGGEPNLAIADFGLARLSPLDGLEGAGTPHYMAPEQHEDGHDVGPWTDLYALGVMARELAWAEDGTERFPLPRGFDAWLERMTDPRPSHRLATAAEARHALEALGPALDPPSLDAIAPIWSTAAVTREAVTRPAQSLSAPSQPTRSGVQPILRSSDLALPLDQPPPAPLRPRLPAHWRESLALGPIHVVGAGQGLYGFRALPMVGREAERDALWQGLEEVLESDEDQSRALFLAGAAGVGKTALAEWIARRASETIGAEVVRVPMREDPRQGSELFSASRTWLGCEHATTADETRAALQRSLPRVLGEVDANQIEALTRVLSRRGIEPPATMRECRRVAVRTLADVSRRRPLILLLDDLHWDVGAMRVVSQLLRVPGRVFIVATIGTDAMPDVPAELETLRRHPAVREVEVGPLPPEEHQRVVRELLSLSQGLAEKVEARTNGNPMFAVQLVGDWVSRGLLRIHKTSLILAPNAEERLPDDIHALWSSRLHNVTQDRVSDGVVLELAATIGLTPELSEWRAAAHSLGLPVGEWLLDRLERSQLLVRTADGEAARFTHGMIRESLLRSAEEGGRTKAWNAAIADALMPRFQAGERDLAERLGHHLRLAGRRDDAHTVMLVAARRAAATGRLEDSLELLRQCAEQRSPDDDRGAAEAVVVSAGVFNRMGRLDDAAAAAGRALRLAGERWPELEAEALHELGYADTHRGKRDLAESHLSRAVELMEASGSRDKLARTLRAR